MHPTLFHLGPIPIRSYGFMMMLGFLAAVITSSRRAKKCGADPEFVTNLALLALLSGVIGARIFYVIHHWPLFAATENPIWSAINLTAGGLEFYGGFLTAVLCIYIYLRRKNKSIRWYLDILAPAIMLGLAFGRIGCFLNSCCWGKPTTLPIAVRFPYASLPFEQQWNKTHLVKVPAEFILYAPDNTPFLIDRNLIQLTDEQLKKELETAKPNSGRGVLLNILNTHLQEYHITMAGLRKLIKQLDLRTKPIHPTQLYSSFMALMISLFLSWYFWHHKYDGEVFVLMFIIYPINRFLIEMLRADNPHDTFGLTISQFISLVAIPIALMAFISLRFLPDKSPRKLAELREANNESVSEKQEHKQ